MCLRLLGELVDVEHASLEGGTGSESEAPDWVAVKFGLTPAFSDTNGERELPELVQDVRKALFADSRIRDLSAPTDLEPGWDHTYPFWPRVSSDVEASLRGSDRLRGFRTVEPFTFVVDVPPKNQTRTAGYLPQQHWVAWNGIAMVVAWPQPRRELIDSAAGEVVVDVLHEALHGAKMHLHVQHCSTDCVYQFLHGELLVQDGEGPLASGWEAINGGLTHLAETENPDAESIAEELYWEMSIPLWALFDMKNLGRRITELEAVVRDDASRLLETNHVLSESRRQSLWKRVEDIKANHQRRNEGQRRLSRVWWTLSVLNALRGQWDREVVAFRAQTSEPHLASVTRIDSRDIELISRQDLSLVTAALEQTASRMDTRVMAASTAGGAIAGAVAGGLLSVLGA